MNQFESTQYRTFKTWEKIIFWIGVLSFLNITYWIVRLVLYLVLKDTPLKRRVDAYAMQTYVFGWVNVITLAILIAIFTVLGMAMLWIIPAAVVTS